MAFHRLLAILAATSLGLACGKEPQTSSQTQTASASSDGATLTASTGPSTSESESTTLSPTAGPATDTDVDSDSETDSEAETDSDSATDSDTGTPDPLIFSAIGDTPYEDEDAPALLEHLQQHNAASPSQFLVHLGDIKRGAPPCVSSEYTDIRDILHTLDVPALIIPGDNEWNDCEDPDAAWDLWLQHLYQLEQHWNPAPPLTRQPDRLENFAWVDHGVLLIGINLVGGAIHDPDEWALRFEQNVNWIDQQFATHHHEIFAAVVFGHALPDLGNHQNFLDGFEAVLEEYLTPTLFLHGDGHFWVHEQDYLGLEHATRVMVECCSAKPIQITVDASHPQVFAIEREPF